MDDDMVLLPRAVVEQLVDPIQQHYIDDERGYCRHCHCEWISNDTSPYADVSKHKGDCPVRVVQERLKEMT